MSAELIAGIIMTLVLLAAGWIGVGFARSTRLMTDFGSRLPATKVHTQAKSWRETLTWLRETVVAMLYVLVAMTVFGLLIAGLSWLAGWLGRAIFS